jgi:hypothetical protein
MTKPTTIPAEAELEEPHHRLDDMIVYLSKLRDPELNHWFVESLAEAMDVSIIPVPDDPLDRADALADRWVTAIWTVGRNKSLRAVATKRAGRKIRELMDVIAVWLEEAGG